MRLGSMTQQCVSAASCRAPSVTWPLVPACWRKAACPIDSARQRCRAAAATRNKSLHWQVPAQNRGQLRRCHKLRPSVVAAATDTEAAETRGQQGASESSSQADEAEQDQDGDRQLYESPEEALHASGVLEQEEEEEEYYEPDFEDFKDEIREQIWGDSSDEEEEEDEEEYEDGDADEDEDGDAAASGKPQDYLEPPIEQGGYTPFQYIDFSDDELRHEVPILVNAPFDRCWEIWADRLNYLEWFDLIHEMALPQEAEEYAAFFLFYRWGQLPLMELYVAMERTEMERDESAGVIIEESVEGMNLVAGVEFQQSPDGESTLVTFKAAYFMPEMLASYVGPVGLYGDVNDILKENMAAYKEFVENVDLEALREARANDREEMSTQSDDFKADLQERREHYEAAKAAAEEGQRGRGRPRKNDEYFEGLENLENMSAAYVGDEEVLSQHGAARARAQDQEEEEYMEGDPAEEWEDEDLELGDEEAASRPGEEASAQQAGGTAAGPSGRRGRATAGGGGGRRKPRANGQDSSEGVRRLPVDELTPPELLEAGMAPEDL